MRQLNLLPLVLFVANGLVIPVRIRHGHDRVRSAPAAYYRLTARKEIRWGRPATSATESQRTRTRRWLNQVDSSGDRPMPSFLRLPLQVSILLAVYAFHLTVLSQHVWAFPVEIGTLSSIGFDSISGIIVTLGYLIRKSRQNPVQVPWNLPSDDEEEETSGDADGAVDIVDAKDASFAKKLRRIPWQLIRFRVTFAAACFMLVKAYFQTGRLSLFWEDLLYEQSYAGWPLTAALTRSLQVLLGHLSWVATGSAILWLVPRPPSFFGSTRKRTRKPKYNWFRISTRNNWLWWTIGGYFVSSWLFNMADSVNQMVLPAKVLRDAAEAESVVAQLVQPEYNDMAALLTGYLAPCISAPVWEEILYRGFLLAGLHATTRSFTAASLVQAIIFSAHHMSVTGALPLAVLGWTWAVLYTQSRNLLTVIVLHAMWNSRVFLGSWLGL